MEFSEKIDQIAPAIVLLHTKVKDVKVDGTGAFSNRYATLGAVLEATKDPLFECGLCLSVFVDQCDGKPAITSLLMHTSGQWMRSTTPLCAAKMDAPGICGAVTYYKRYAICSILGITNDEDDDAETSQGRGKHPDYKDQKQKEAKKIAEKIEKKTQEKPVVQDLGPKISSDQYKQLDAMLKDLENIEQYIKKTLNIKNLNEIPAARFDNILKYVQQQSSVKKVV